MTERLSDERGFAAVGESLKRIREEIAEAAIKSGRQPSDIQLMAVTKTVEPEYINYVIENGVDLIGENKVQEFLSKKEFLKLDSCKAHIIGHLQTNKVRKIVGLVDTIQSVDSIKLAKEISLRSVSAGVTTNILAEVNIGEEEGKTGISKNEVEELICACAELPGIKVKGLMAIPPFSEDANKTRVFFSNMNQLFIDISAKKLDNINMEVLSMGMSGDYREAILEGSNLVRVGTALFGGRKY